MPEQTAAMPHPLRGAPKPRPAGSPAPPGEKNVTASAQITREQIARGQISRKQAEMPPTAMSQAAPPPTAATPSTPPQAHAAPLPGASPEAFKQAFPEVYAQVSARLAPEANPESAQKVAPSIPRPADEDPVEAPTPVPDFTTAARAIAVRRHAAVNRGTVWEFLRQLLLFAVLLCAVFGLVFGVLPCPDDDMMPRIGAGDLLLYYRADRAKTPVAGQIIVFDKDGDRRIGRVVAKEGDVVEITDDAQLKVNGSIVTESYIYESTPRYDDLVNYPLALSEGCCFVLSDTREGGHDSRYFGAVTAAERRGRVITVLRRSNL